MTKQEFLETLGKILKRELSETETQENLHYYDSYIAQECAKGKTEQQVLEELGDPRLIARTILQVDEQREEKRSFVGDASAFTEDDDDGDRMDGVFGGSFYDGGTGGGLHRIPGWKIALTLVLIGVVFFMVVGLVFRVVWALLPIILAVMAAVWIYRRFFR